MKKLLTKSETVDYTFEKQKIALFLRFFGNVIGGIVDLEFRYVLIPGTQAGGRLMNAPVDYEDYKQPFYFYNGMIIPLLLRSFCFVSFSHPHRVLLSSYE
jgi:hypothetical protein